MNKLILSLGLLAALAAPAAAGRLDDADPSVRQDYVATERNVDYSATRSIGAGTVSTDDQSSKQRGDQGAFFGANGR